MATRRHRNRKHRARTHKRRHQQRGGLGRTEARAAKGTFKQIGRDVGFRG